MAAGQSRGTSSEPGRAADVLVLCGGLLVAAVWAGAQLASRFGRDRWLGAGIGQAMGATFRLPAHGDNPRLAWAPELRPGLPGPVLYWACTGAVLLVALTAAVVVFARFSRREVGTDPRTRLGVDTRARLAKPKDLAPLVVSGPTPGRFILGRVGGKLVATETAHGKQRRGRGWSRRRGDHDGDRSAVAVIGPTRCGKTANTISSILEWKGPALLSSVKDDLLMATIEQRSEIGKVLVFDPTGVTDKACAGWSLLWDSNTITGAQKAARALTATGPGGTHTIEFFNNLAQQLMWPLFYAARCDGAHMDDVVHWVLSRDREKTNGEGVVEKGKVMKILEKQLAHPDADRRKAARAAIETLRSVWTLDHRTRSHVYVTAQALLSAWQDPMVATATRKADITLDWLVKGANTIYICAPPHEQERLSPVFGGLINDLMQQAYEWRGRKGSRLPDTLVVLDEAANTPTRWLPNWASTCSGIGILLVTVWQSKAQINAAYGVQADSVLTNHGTKVIFSGVSDATTLDYASRLVGDEEVSQRSASADLTSGHRTIFESTTRVRLLPGDVLRQAARFQGLLIHGTLPPAHLVARRYYDERRLRALSGDGAKRVAESLGARSEPDKRETSIVGSPPSECR